MRNAKKKKKKKKQQQQQQRLNVFKQPPFYHK